MNIFRDRRAVYIATGALLTTFVVTAGSILTYTLIAPEIEKRKDENNLDLAKDSLMDLNSQVLDLLAKGPNSTAIFTMVVPGGDISVDEDQNSVSYLTRTKVDYNPGSKSTLSVSRSTKNTLSMDSSLPVDLVSRYDNIKPGQYTVVLTFEKERLFRIEDWTLHKNTTFAGTVSSSTSNYYTSRLNETDIDWDINRDGDKNDIWRLYLSDPNEDYIFDTVAVHNHNPSLLQYNVMRNGSSIVNTTSLRYRDTGLSDSDVYTYEVEAVRNTTVAVFGPATVTTEVNHGPSRLTVNSLTVTKVNESKVDLNWCEFQEGDTLELDSTPIMVYRVRERYVVFRYAQMKMVVK